MDTIDLIQAGITALNCTDCDTPMASSNWATFKSLCAGCYHTYLNDDMPYRARMAARLALTTSPEPPMPDDEQYAKYLKMKSARELREFARKIRASFYGDGPIPPPKPRF